MVIFTSAPCLVAARSDKVLLESFLTNLAPARTRHVPRTSFMYLYGENHSDYVFQMAEEWLTRYKCHTVGLPTHALKMTFKRLHCRSYSLYNVQQWMHLMEETLEWCDTISLMRNDLYRVRFHLRVSLLACDFIVCLASYACCELTASFTPYGIEKTIFPVTRCEQQKNPRPPLTTNVQLLCAEEHERIYLFIHLFLAAWFCTGRTHTHYPRLFSVESGKPSATQR